MVKVQTPDAATGYHTTREEREFSEDGTTMTLRFQSISNGLSRMVGPMDFKKLWKLPPQNQHYANDVTTHH